MVRMLLLMDFLPLHTLYLLMCILANVGIVESACLPFKNLFAKLDISKDISKAIQSLEESLYKLCRKERQNDSKVKYYFQVQFKAVNLIYKKLKLYPPHT